jgi:hypothetical protein
MATWGSTDTSGEGILAINVPRYFGGQFGAVGGVLNSLNVYMNSLSGGGPPTCAIYIGGSDTSPVGATLLEALGQLPTVTTPGWAQKLSASHPTIPANARVWIAMSLASTSNQIRQNGSVIGNFNYGYSSDNVVPGDNTYAWPSTVPATAETAVATGVSIYLDYTAVSGATGAMDAGESGSDVLAAAGSVGNNGLRLILRDTDTGALAANLTGVIVSVRPTSNAESTLYKTTSGTTNASGVYELASNAIGSLGTYVYVTVEKADSSIAALFRVQVIDLNA